MRNYEVIEDNGGGLTLVVFNKNGKVDYLHSGYEYGKHGRLICDLEALKNASENDIIVASGSLYMIGDMRKIINKTLAK